jgi:hypothetical protein
VVDGLNIPRFWRDYTAEIPAWLFPLCLFEVSANLVGYRHLQMFQPSIGTKKIS